jgi:hypothetical protein
LVTNIEGRLKKSNRRPQGPGSDMVGSFGTSVKKAGPNDIVDVASFKLSSCDRSLDVFETGQALHNMTTHDRTVRKAVRGQR